MSIAQITKNRWPSCVRRWTLVKREEIAIAGKIRCSGATGAGSLELEFEEFAMLITKLTQGSDSSSWRMKQGFGWQHSFKAGAFFGETSLLDKDSGMNATLEAVGGAGAKFMVLDRRSFQASTKQ
jgi:hypothetical protein